MSCEHGCSQLCTAAWDWQASATSSCQYLRRGAAFVIVVATDMPLRMQGAEQMSHNEHLLNVYVSKYAVDSCADFFGYSVVESAKDVNDRRITPGKWLVRSMARNLAVAANVWAVSSSAQTECQCSSDAHPNGFLW